MPKTLVKFTKTWDKYVAGDVAGFDPTTAENLTSGKRAVGKKHGTAAVTASVGSEGALNLDGVRGELEAQSRELNSRAVDLEQKETSLAEREAQMAEREKKLAEAEVATKESAETAGKDETGSGEGGKAEAGAPPKQGQKSSGSK